MRGQSRVAADENLLSLLHSQMDRSRCLVYFRFPAANLPSSVQIVRKESIIAYRSMVITLTPFSRHVDVLSGDYTERSIARIRIPILFWIFYSLRQTELMLYVIERQGEIGP